MTNHHNHSDSQPASSAEIQRTLDFVPKPSPTAELPPPARKSSTTSCDAAASIEDLAPGMRGRVYEAICRAADGLTRPEIAERTQISLQSVCPRVGELKRLGLIIERGTRETSSGRSAGILYASNARKPT